MNTFDSNMTVAFNIDMTAFNKAIGTFSNNNVGDF